MAVSATQPPPTEARGFLWFLRLVALTALPLYSLASAVGIGAEVVVLALVVGSGVLGAVIAARLTIGRFHFALVGAICLAEAVLITYAIVR
jgi:hypothetical protein